MEVSSFRLKKSLIFQERTCNIWKIKKNLYFLSSKCKRKKEEKKEKTKKENKRKKTVPYKQAKFSQLNYFLMFIIKCLFLFYIFFYTQPVNFFHLHNHIVFFLRCFCSLSLFSWQYLQNNIFVKFYLHENNNIKNSKIILLKKEFIEKFKNVIFKF